MPPAPRAAPPAAPLSAPVTAGLPWILFKIRSTGIAFLLTRDDVVDQQRALGAKCFVHRGTSGFGQDEKEKVEPAAEKEAAGSKKPDPKPQPKKEEAKKEVIAVVGADIITVTRERIRNGTILIEDGKITGLGTSVEIPLIVGENIND